MLVNGISANTISIRDRGLLYGDGVFRTLLVLKGKVQHWALHYQKLQHDCAALQIVCPEEALLCVERDQVLSQHPEGVLKLIITRGMGTRGYRPQRNASPTRIWDFFETPDYPAAWLAQGIKACLCTQRLAEHLAGVKHLNRLENVLALADDEQAAEGLMLDAAGHLIEGTRSNLFLVHQGELVTPDVSRCGVAGIQRDRVMAWALQQGVTLKVREVELSEALLADELFVVNSIFGLWSIRELQSRQWHAFPLAEKIRPFLALEDN